MITVRPEDLPAEGEPPPAAMVSSGRRVTGLAWLALALGAVSILFLGVAVGPVAVVTGIVAALQAERRRGLGRQTVVACAGILLGLAGAVLWGALLFRWLDAASAGGAAKRTAAPPVTAGTLDRDAIAQAPEPIRRALTSSASLRILRRNGTEWIPESSGSGTFVGRADGRWFVLTCAHVAASAKPSDPDRRLRVQWVGGEMPDPRLEWVGPEWLDLAIVSTSAGSTSGEPSTAPIVAAWQLGVGDHVFAIGDPHEYRASYVTGVLSAVRIVSEGPTPLRVLQSQVPLNPGNSGGGLYNAAGQLIGVNSWKLGGTSGEGMGFSIAIENLWAGAEGAPDPVARMVEALRAQTTGTAGAPDSKPPARR